MPLLSGNTSGSIMSTGYNIPCTIKSFSLYNKTAGSVTASLAVVVSGSERYVYQATLAALGSADSSYYQLTDIHVPADCQILIITNAGGLGIDYTVTID